MQSVDENLIMSPTSSPANTFGYNLHGDSARNQPYLSGCAL